MSIIEASTLPRGRNMYRKPKTNADRIRAMSDEELADELLDYFAAFYSVEWSREELVGWLKQEAET